MTDHTKALADALEKIARAVEDQLDPDWGCGCDSEVNHPRLAPALKAAREALAAYRASEQASTTPRCQAAHVCDCREAGQPCQRPSTAVELPEPLGTAEIDVGYDIQAGGRLIQCVDAYTAEQLTAYGNARAAEARRVALPTAEEIDTAIGDADCALNNEQRAAVHAAIRALITKG